MEHRMSQILTSAFVAAGDLEGVNASLQPENVGMFSVPLSPAGVLPATHWGACGVVERSVVAVPGITWYRWDLDSASLVEASVDTDDSGDWSWAASLSNLGLQTIYLDD
jgi:hypothetical protein